MKPLTFWQRLGRAIQDRSFIMGSFLVALLVLAAVLGPEMAPHNPYLRDRIQYIDGNLGKAPFPPSDVYPLGTDDQGRDMLSLLIYGARQTLVIAFVSTVVRLLLGLILGTLAGWWPSSLFDRALTALVEFLAAIPGLILAIMVILAIGIRRGEIAFIAALSLVGWGEVTQIVRGHVLVIRKKLYIEAARAVGLSVAEILSRHVLPNLLATMLALAALEMGSVLLLLGELGFVYIFVGGGGRYVDDSVQMGQVVQYFEIPDWGAMLGTSWRWFRSYPWLPMMPAVAFFVAILSFNLFGYGLQRFIERGRFHPSGWSLLRFFAVVALLLLGARALLASGSVESYFAQQVRQFDVTRAFHDMAFLSHPDLEGRPSGPGGGYLAAGYIAAQFEEAGLTPLPDGTYFQRYTGIRGQVTAPPTLEVLDASGEPSLRLTSGVSLDPWQPFEAEGSVEDELVVVGNVSHVREGGVLLLLNPNEELRVPWSGRLPYAAILRLVPDDELAPNDQAPPFNRSAYRPDFANLMISESAARQMLNDVGVNLEELQAAWESGESIALRTGLRIRLTYGLIYREVPAVNVVGYLPAADMATQGDRILVVTSYTGPSPEAGEFYPGADENASGVAVMLEVARLWHDLRFDPKRTVVFAAFDEAGGSYFANRPTLPSDVSDTWTAVIIYGVGAGGPRLARQEVGYGLSRVFDQSARRFGMRTEEMETWRFFFALDDQRMGWSSSANPAFTGLAVERLGDSRSGTPADTLDRLDPRQFTETGQMMAHFLMVLSSR
jgi:peptide/nickel transport system permease protein